MAKSAKTNRIFVAKSHVGPYPQGHAFDESDFRRVHPIPEKPETVGIDPETYHDGLINRLLAAGVIVESPQASPQPAPAGAHPATLMPVVASAAQGAAAVAK